MMKFLKYVLATVIGIFLFLILSMLLFSIIFSIAKPDMDQRLAERPVLKITLDKVITEREAQNVFASFAGPESGTLGLLELRKAIKKADRTNSIKGILLDIKHFSAGFAQLEELRNELIQFKETGKFVYAYSDSYSQMGYYLASIADKIFLSPHGDMEFRGFNSELLFIAGTLEKLDLKPEVFRAGEFKSAVEMFTEKEMSKESKEQLSELLGSVFNSFLDNISQARGIDVNKLRNIADSLLLRKAEDAMQLGFVSHLAYFDSLETTIRQEAGIDNKKEIKYAHYTDFIDFFESGNGAQKVAVVVADGQIVMGDGKRDMVGADKFTREIRKARLDNDVKAIVIRINSPGGSALASDLIWREIEMASRTKPVIASMSDVAASGGYYLAAACDTIMAHPTTITGSIGVFGLILTGPEFLKNKFGITTDGVKTSPMADIGSFTREMNDRERAIIQKEVDRIYKQFKEVVAMGRGLKNDYVESVANGRVWSGTEAKRNKLADVFGGLDEAIQMAAEKAKLSEDYSVVYLPEIKYPFLNQMLMSLFEDEEDSFEEFYGRFAIYFQTLKGVKDNEGIQARLPYEIKID